MRFRYVAAAVLSLGLTVSACSAEPDKKDPLASATKATLRPSDAPEDWTAFELGDAGTISLPEGFEESESPPQAPAGYYSGAFQRGTDMVLVQAGDPGGPLKDSAKDLLAQAADVPDQTVKVHGFLDWPGASDAWYIRKEGPGWSEAQFLIDAGKNSISAVVQSNSKQLSTKEVDEILSTVKLAA